MATTQGAGTTSEESSKKCAFLDKLPPELRLEIYDYHMSDIFNESLRQVQEGDITKFDKPTSPLLRTCKLIREEVRKPMFLCCLQVQQVLLLTCNGMLEDQQRDFKKANAPTTDLGELFRVREKLVAGRPLIEAWNEGVDRLQRELDEDEKQLVADGLEL